MINNNKVKIKVKDENDDFINYLFRYNIFYSSLIHFNCYYILVVDFNDYKKISRRFKTIVINYYGKKYILDYIDKNKYILLSLMICFFVLYLLTNTIYKININTNDDNIKKIIENSLFENDIIKYKKKKSFKELQRIKNKILDDNKDTLEWIEINESGCIYNIDITKRVVKKEDLKDNKPSNIIAKKDGLIKYMTVSSGVKVKDVNDYVKKGDIIVSGNVTLNEEKLVNQVPSQASVYAEVWYLVNISVPFKYVEYVKTGNIINHYYLELFGKKFTIMGKYDSLNTMSQKKLILDKPYLFFKLYKEEKTEYEYKEFNINHKQAYNEAIKRSELSIKKKLQKDEYIISKKVLKNNVKSSKIDVEVFFKVYENIALTSNIE